MTNHIIQKIQFDISNENTTIVSLKVLELKNEEFRTRVYTKAFAADISALELFQDHIFDKDQYLEW